MTIFLSDYFFILKILMLLQSMLQSNLCRVPRRCNSLRPCQSVFGHDPRYARSWQPKAPSVLGHSPVDSLEHLLGLGGARPRDHVLATGQREDNVVVALAKTVSL